MIEIPLQPVPNQSFSVQLDGARYELTFKHAAGIMCVDVTRDDVELLRGHRVVAWAPLLPYRHMEAGNFCILTEDDDLPHYSAFGYTQTLVYVSPEELAELKAGA